MKNALQVTERYLDTLRFTTKRKLPWDTRTAARVLLAELGVQAAAPVGARTVGAAGTTDDLASLKPDTVIRDAEGVVFERWQMGWTATGSAEPYTPVTPVTILALPEDAAS